MMLNPKPRPSAPVRRLGFDHLIEDATRHYQSRIRTPDFAIESGVNVYALVRYAAAQCDDHEKQAVESDLCRLPWCMEVVVALVKSKRTTAHPLLARADSGTLEEVDEETLAGQLEALRAG